MLICATTRAEWVRNVDVSRAPELRELGEQARRVGEEMYPRILEVLTDDRSQAARQFDIVFKHIPTGDRAETDTEKAKVYLNTDCFERSGTNGGWEARSPISLQVVLAHELAHVAEGYPVATPWYWKEGMAEYARYKVGLTNGWGCPQCSAQYPHYTSGYMCAGAFLLHLDSRYGAKVARQLNRELRQGTFSDQFFVHATGRTLAALWKEFQTTPEFTPVAAERNQFQLALGGPEGTASDDFAARCRSYLQRQPGGTLSLEAGEFLAALGRRGLRPGWPAEERGVMSLGLLDAAQPDSYPATRTFHGQKNADPSIYHYILTRAGKDCNWRLERAWRTDAEGRTAEEYPVPPRE